MIMMIVVIMGVHAVHVWVIVLLEVEKLSQVLHNSSVFWAWLSLLRSLWLSAFWLTLLWLLLFNWSIWIAAWRVCWIWFVLRLSRSFSLPLLL